MPPGGVRAQDVREKPRADLNHFAQDEPQCISLDWMDLSSLLVLVFKHVKPGNVQLKLNVSPIPKQIVLQSPGVAFLSSHAS